MGERGEGAWRACPQLAFVALLRHHVEGRRITIVRGSEGARGALTAWRAIPLTRQGRTRAIRQTYLQTKLGGGQLGVEVGGGGVPARRRGWGEVCGRVCLLAPFVLLDSHRSVCNGRERNRRGRRVGGGGHGGPRREQQKEMEVDVKWGVAPRNHTLLP